MAYVIELAPTMAKLPYLPLSCVLKNGEEAVVQDYSDEDFEDVYVLINTVMEEGQAFPNNNMDREDFRRFVETARVFVLKKVKDGSLIGTFFTRPNYPGRSSHICNSGFAVNHIHRRKGALQLMAKSYLRIARDLGYKGSYFNLVYASNAVAIHTYKKLGFVQVGLTPKAGDLKGLGMVDALQFYYDLTTLDEDGCPPGGWKC